MYGRIALQAKGSGLNIGFKMQRTEQLTSKTVLSVL